MKLKSRKRFSVGRCEFGGEVYRIFGSVAPASKAELNEQLALAGKSRIDAVEIILNEYPDLERFPEDLKEAKDLLGGTLVSLRIQKKGTDARIDETKALAALSACIENKLAAFVDVEADIGSFTENVRALLSGSETRLILTQQDYRGPDSPRGVLETAMAVEAMGPDLVRVLYLAADDVDMLHIAQAARKAKTDGSLKTPFCISAIGEAGLMLRLFGERCGNDFGSYPLFRKDGGGFALETLPEYQRLREIYTVDSKYSRRQKESGEAG